MGVHLHSNTVGTHALTVGTPVLRQLGTLWIHLHLDTVGTQTLGVGVHLHSDIKSTPALKLKSCKELEENPFVDFQPVVPSVDRVSKFCTIC